MAQTDFSLDVPQAKFKEGEFKYAEVRQQKVRFLPRISFVIKISFIQKSGWQLKYFVLCIINRVGLCNCAEEHNL